MSLDDYTIIGPLAYCGKKGGVSAYLITRKYHPFAHQFHVYAMDECAVFPTLEQASAWVEEKSSAVGGDTRTVSASHGEEVPVYQ